MTLRARLTLLFLAAVQVTFISAIGAYWAIQSWRLVTEEHIALHRQQIRLGVVLDRVAAQRRTFPTDARLQTVLAHLRRSTQTVDETEHVTRLDGVVATGSAVRTREAVRRLTRYYEGELGRLTARGVALGGLSNVLLGGIVVLVIASFIGFLAAIRAWLVEPVRALERATEIMSTGDLTPRITLPNQGELGRLASSINQMAGSLAHIQNRLVTSERFALLGELAAYVAHNIRNPLASIRATAQGEAIELAAADPRREALDDIVNAVDRLDAWVGDLLRSVSPVALERRAGSLNTLVERCIELALPRLRAGGVELDLAAEATPELTFDGAKLEQVVSAVLANATDASPPGSRVEVRVEQEGAAVRLRIADQGSGVSRNGHGSVFTPFATSKASGTGIGLWLSQKIVAAHGGTIELRAANGGGTTVEIRLPITEDPSCQPS
jgi:signal transduction histidine kinase